MTRPAHMCSMKDCPYIKAPGSDRCQEHGGLRASDSARRIMGRKDDIHRDGEERPNSESPDEGGPTPGEPLPYSERPGYVGARWSDGFLDGFLEALEGAEAERNKAHDEGWQAGYAHGEYEAQKRIVAEVQHRFEDYKLRFHEAERRKDRMDANDCRAYAVAMANLLTWLTWLEGGDDA